MPKQKARSRWDPEFKILHQLWALEEVFERLNPGYLLPRMIIFEIAYAAFSPAFDRMLPRESPIPGLPAPRHANNCVMISLNQTLMELERLDPNSERFFEDFERLHLPAIYFLHHAGLTSSVAADLSKADIDNCIRVARRAVAQGRRLRPKFAVRAKGQERKGRASYIAAVLADQYAKATGSKATIRTKQVAGKYTTTSATYGPYVELVRDVFAIFEINASPQSMAREIVALQHQGFSIEPDPDFEV